MFQPDSGAYKIALGGSLEVLTGSGGDAEIDRWTRQDSQMWLFKPLDAEPGWYSIADKASGLVLDGSGTQASLAAWSASPSQMWSFEAWEDGSSGYKVVQKSSGNALCSPPGGLAANASIEAFGSLDSESFRWGLDPVLQHIVVLMLENRSLDNLLGYLYGPQDKPAHNLPPLKPGETEYHGLAFENTAELANSATVDDESITQAPVPVVRASNTPGWDPGEEYGHVNTQLFGANPPPLPPPISGSHYIDPKTDLAWLPLTETLGQTFPEVSAKLEPGGSLADYRRASNAEVLQLFGDSGITISAGGAATPVSAVQALIEAMGDTGEDGTTLSSGFTADYGYDETRAIGVLQLVSPTSARAYISKSAPSATNQGHWLVYKTVSMKGFLADYAGVSEAAAAAAADADAADADAVRQIMHSYSPVDAPVINTLARGYAVSDSWFCSVPTQTNANRAFSLCGTSLGLVDNGFLTKGVVNELFKNDHFPTDTIWNVLHDNKFTDWKIFWQEPYPTTSDKPYTWNSFPYLNKIPDVRRHFVKVDQFYALAKNGRLPAFSYVEPSWAGAVRDLSVMGNDYHPPADTTPGEAFLKRVYKSLVKNQAAWARTLFLIVFDEHGGTYDHVPPPWGALPPWGYATPTNLPKGLQHDFQFDRFGVRVPAIVCSALVEERTVFRPDDRAENHFKMMPFDHGSIIATVLEQLLPGVDRQDYGLGERVANAPTFSHVLTRRTSRSDNVLAPGPPPKMGSDVRYGESFYLQNRNGSYVTPVDTGHFHLHYYPQLGKDPATLSFRLGWGNVAHGAVVQIRTDEMLEPELPIEFGLAAIRNMLGRWEESDCYYWSSNDAKAYTQLRWRIENAKGRPGAIVYGDKVYLTNLHYAGQRLTANGQYLTTAPGASDHWVIMPAPLVP